MTQTPTLKHQISSLLDQLEARSGLRSIDRVEDDFAYDLTTNDYLGLSDFEREDLINIIASSENQSLKDQLEIYLLQHEQVPFGGSTGSRLISGNNNMVRSFEQKIGQQFSDSCRSERECLVFNSGYHANIGIIPALAQLDSATRHSETPIRTMVLMDRLVHASIIDGVRLSGLDFRRFHHNDLHHLKELLEQFADRYDNIVVICESIYSMDGDSPPSLEQLAVLKSEFADRTNVILYLDEAHAVGLYGANRFGLAEEEEVAQAFDIIVCPLGKAVNSHGCLVFTTPLLKKFLVNTVRSFIYTTALPEKIIDQINLNFMAVQTEVFREAGEDLLEFCAGLREAISDTIHECYSEQYPHLDYCLPQLVLGTNQISCLVLGSNEAVLDAKAFFAAHDVKVSAIRYPTVGMNSERIRFSPKWTEDEDDLDEVINVFVAFIKTEIYASALEDIYQRLVDKGYFRDFGLEE